MEVKKIDREEIINELIKQGYVRKLITYTELQTLYSKYGKGMSEKDFALEILNIPITSYYQIKNKGMRVGILKQIEFSQEKIEGIQNKLLEDGYVGKLIDYDELQLLHQKYCGEMPEKEFASIILNLNDAQYFACKNRKRKVKVLNNRKISEEEKNRIIEQLKKDGYEGKLITYLEIQMLHQKYCKQLPEKEFAIEILGISYANYQSCKNKGGRRRAFAYKKPDISDEKINEIVARLKLKRLCRKNGYIC